MAKQNSKASEPNISNPSAVKVGLQGCCPKCGQGRLYSKLLTPANSCKACGLDYSFIDAGDGPAFFVILIISFVLMTFAVIVETNFHPPIWLHMVLWGPLIIGGSLWGLRFSKGFMIAMQYQTAAGEGRLDQ